MAIDMLMRDWRLFFAVAAIALSREFASAQVAPPFYSPAGTAFTPEIGVVNTGILHDAQGIVSADRKHVTLTMGEANARLLALQEFSPQQGGIQTTNGSAAASASARDLPPVEVTILDRRGITRVD